MLKRKKFFYCNSEKALLDSIYLMFLGRCSLDLAAIEFHRFDRELLADMSEYFPERSQNLLRAHEYLTVTRDI